mgnify:CR=1 FL=1
MRNSLNNYGMLVKLEQPAKLLFIRFTLVECGFFLYDELSYQFTLFYQICSEKIYKQKHYDWDILFVYHILWKTCCTNELQDENQLLKKTNKKEKSINRYKIVNEDQQQFYDLHDEAFIIE